ncbi:hypothetical protein GCM10020221_25570 [Streptomyces thioluteus]|uniref:Uncharacterized protein n=1 Tax=Streptomyces thioluteus TaxID=66431 RepID=A0ABN3WVY8_STRTU
MPLEAGLLEILACPACHAPLREEAGASDETAELVCTSDGCALAYPRPRRHPRPAGGRGPPPRLTHRAYPTAIGD